MLRRHLDRGEILVVGQQRHFLGGGDMQDMHPPAGGLGEPQQAPGGDHRGLDVAPLGMQDRRRPAPSTDDAVP